MCPCRAHQGRVWIQKEFELVCFLLSYSIDRSMHVVQILTTRLRRITREEIDLKSVFLSVCLFDLLSACVRSRALNQTTCRSSASYAAFENKFYGGGYQKRPMYLLFIKRETERESNSEERSLSVKPSLIKFASTAFLPSLSGG